MLRRSGRRFLASCYLRFLSSFTREDGSRAATFGGTFTVNQPGACETPILRRRATSARALCLFPLRWATSTTLYLNVEQLARLNARSLYKEFHLDGKPDRRGEHQLQQRFDPAWRRDGQLYRTDQLLRKQARGATLAQASRRLYGPDSRLKVSDTPVAIHNRN